jgi:hypothetical protein
MDRKGLIYAAIYGATASAIAYVLSFGSLVAFIAIMAAFGIAVRVWAWRYRARHGLPLRGHFSSRESRNGSDNEGS